MSETKKEFLSAQVVVDSAESKVPPHSVEAEQSVLGGMMIDNRAITKILEIVEPEDFYITAHRIIFEAIRDLSNSGQPADILTVGEHLNSRGLLDSIGGIEFLASLQDAVPTVANIDAHAKMVKEKSAVRACINASLEILARGYGNYGDVEEFLDEAEKKIFDATHKKSLSSVIPISKALTDTFQQFDRLSVEKSYITGVPTGFRQLDRITCGLQNSDLIIIAGRPSMGKTSFALNIAVNAAREENKRVSSVIFSLEMSIYQLMLRLLSSEAEVEASKLRIPSRLTNDEFQRLTTAADYLNSAPIFLDDSPELNVLEIRSRARRLKDEHDIGLIIVDYLQILRPTPAIRKESREREVAEMSRALKSLAKELNVPVVALSQLNRRPDVREKNKPQLADLRESGAIEQDADLIMFLYRPGFYHPAPDPQMDRIAEVIIGKNRNGPTDTVKLEFIKEYTRFNDPEGEPFNFAGETEVDGVDFERGSF